MNRLSTSDPSLRQPRSARVKSAPVASLLRQTDHFARTFLHLKSWRFLLGLIAALPLALGAFLSVILGGCDLTSEPDLKFYRSVDITTAWQLLADRADAPMTSLEVSRGGEWPRQECLHSVERCAIKIFEMMKPLFGFQAWNAKATPVMLECFQERRQVAELACTFLYQLNSVNESRSQTQYSDLTLFRLLRINSTNSSDHAEPAPIGGIQPTSGRCSISNKLFRTVLEISFSIGTMTIIVYFTVTTVYCIARLKLTGFLQLQYRSGLRAMAYWLPVWAVTFVECCALSSVFYLAHVAHCPMFAQSQAAPSVFVAFTAHCGSIAALAILAATVQASFNASCMLMTLLNLALITGFAYAPEFIRNGPAAVTFLFPPINTLQYIITYISSDGSVNLSASEAEHYRRALPCIVATPIVLALVTIYLDFLLPAGNGLCLPAYFPISGRFWIPADPLRGDSEGDGHPVESVTGTAPLVTVNKVSVVYNRTCRYGSCSQTKALNSLSCEIYPGQITWVLGSRWSGKSTLLNLLGGTCLSPTHGSVTLDGCQATGPLDRLGLRSRIGAASSPGAAANRAAASPCLTVLRCLALTHASRGAVGAQWTPCDLLGHLGLAGLEDASPADLTQSQGQLLRLGLALAGLPELLLLDEPTRGLDLAESRRVWRLLRDVCGGHSTAVVVAVSDGDLGAEPPRPDDRVLLLSGGELAGAGASHFLARVLGWDRLRPVEACLTSPSGEDDSEVGAVEELRARLPRGTRLLSESDGSRRLRLLADSGALADCVAELEGAAADNLVVDGSVRLLRPTLTDALRLRQRRVHGTTNHNNNSSSESDLPLARGGRQLETLMFPAPAADFDSSRLQPSVFRRFRGLWLLHSRRQVRSKSSLMARLIVPSLALIGLALVAVQSRAHRGMNYLGANSTGVAAQMASHAALTACVHDDTESAESPLSYHECRAQLTLVKPVGEPLLEFLSRSRVVEQLQAASCWTGHSDCLVVYTASWNRIARGSRQGVTLVGLESAATQTEPRTRNHLVHVYRKALADLGAHFGAQISMTEQELAYETSPSHYMRTEFMVLLFAVIFSAYPASFLEDPSEDMESNVYRYLGTLGMTNAVYWTCTFIIQLFQYIIYFVLSIGAFEIWDQFSNPFYITSVCLPVLLLGTASNLLSVYTTVATTRRRNATVKFAYYCLVLIVPFAVHGVAKLGKLPVLAMIWLVPQAAPMALLLFGMRLAGQRTLSTPGRTGEADSLVHQLWDLSSTQWSNEFVVHSMAAMPTHLILLSLVLAASESDCRRVLDKVCSFMRRSSPSRGFLGVNRASAVSGEDLPMTSSPKDFVEDSAESGAGVSSGLNRRLDCTLEVRDLWKTCASNGLPVLRGVTFSLVRGESLVLLGPDTSAKSATAAIAAGVQAQISGECRALCVGARCTREGRGHDPTCGAVGYCPPYSPLLDWLTVSEHLHLFARIRGVPGSETLERVRLLLDQLGLYRHRRWMVGRLSPETRRRLCLAAALLTRPQLLVLDEPGRPDRGEAAFAASGSAAEDEAESGRRLVRRLLRQLTSDGRTTVLATADGQAGWLEGGSEPSVGEPVRFGLVHRGRLAALGTARQLRNQHRDWLTLEAHLESVNSNPASLAAAGEKKKAVSRSVLSQFRGASVLDEGRCWVQFCLPCESFERLSDAVRWLAVIEAKLGLQQLLLCHTTLEQMVLLQQLSSMRSDSTLEEEEDIVD